MMRVTLRLFLLGMGTFCLAVGWWVLGHLAPAVGWLERMGNYLLLVVMAVMGCLWLGAAVWLSKGHPEPQRQRAPLQPSLAFKCEIGREGCKGEAGSYCPEFDRLMCTACDQEHRCSLPHHYAPEIARTMRATFPRVKSFRPGSAAVGEGKGRP